MPVPDLADARGRWPGFADAAAELGVHAVFAFPLRIGMISVGVLLGHRVTLGRSRVSESRIFR